MVWELRQFPCFDSEQEAYSFYLQRANYTCLKFNCKYMNCRMCFFFCCVLSAHYHYECDVTHCWLSNWQAYFTQWIQKNISSIDSLIHYQVQQLWYHMENLLFLYQLSKYNEDLINYLNRDSCCKWQLAFNHWTSMWEMYFHNECHIAYNLRKIFPNFIS